jgi:hypothetical protein
MGFRDLFRKPTKKEVKKKQIRNNAEQGKSGEQQVVARYRLNGWKMTRTGTGSDYRATRKNPRTGKSESKLVEIKSGNAKLSPLQEKKKAQMGSKYVVERVQVNPFMGYRGNDLANKEIADFNQSVIPYTKVKSTRSSTKISKKPTKRKSTTKKTPSITEKIFGSNKPKRKSTTKKTPSITEKIFGSNKPKRKSTTKKKTVKKTAKKPKSFSNAESLWGKKNTKKSTKKKKSSTGKKSSKRKSSSNSILSDMVFGPTKSSKRKSSSKKSSKRKSKSNSNVDWLMGGSSSSSKRSSGSDNVRKIMGSGSGKKSIW